MQTMSLRSTPRFSVNKLAEYLVAGPRRRRSLILDSINPPTVKVIGYEDARHTIVRYFSDQSRTIRQLLDMGSLLRDRAAALG